MAKYESRLNLHFTALADPTRRSTRSRLARGSASVTELAASHDMALPSVLAHLRKLETAGLIVTAKKGRVRLCELSPEAFAPTQRWLAEQREVRAGRLDRLDDCVTTLKQERDR